MMPRDFYDAVKALRALTPRHRIMCLFAAEHWEDERLLAEIAEAEAQADEPTGVHH
jgi:hypothetical protein